MPYTHDSLLSTFCFHPVTEVVRYADRDNLVSRIMEFKKNIPSMKIIREKAPAAFDALQDLLINFDPVTGEFPETNPDKYKFVTRTLLYKLTKKEDRQQIEELVDIELIGWFGQGLKEYPERERLVDALCEFRNEKLAVDPFG